MHFPVLTRGRVREVALLAYPVILTQLSMTTMGVVDSAMVGRLGASELAAVGFGGVWMWTVLCFFIGGASGVQTFVAQYHGADRSERCGAWVWQGLWIILPGVFLAAVILVLVVRPLLAWLAPSAELQPLAASYMSIRAIGSVGMCAAATLSAFFRGIGDTRTPLYVTLFANLLNVVLDYGLIFGHFGLPAWGVAGAATATVIAEWIFAFIMLAMLLRPAIRIPYRTQPAPFRARDQRRLLRTGAPIGGQWLLEMLSFAVFLTLVARMGDASMAASQAFISLLSLSFLQAHGLGMAVATLVGRYIGAEDPAAVERSYRSAQKLTLILSGSVALLFVMAPQLLMRIFTDDPEVLRLGGPLLLIGAVFQFFDAFAIVSDGALRGAGDTRVPFLVRFALAWGLFLPLAWVFGVYLEGGLMAAWLGGSVYIVVLSVYLVWRFRSGAWRAIRI
ncbi:MAG: MATE family efflux transporter [Deltaproteobacteria bacterium]|nr:MATE family efflux transporter [Deltaproteobacteria bacterium]